MTIPAQRPLIPASTLGVLQTRPVPQRPPDASGAPPNPHHRERPIIEGGSTAEPGGPPRRGQLVNILV
jgi:hypothetical protein